MVLRPKPICNAAARLFVLHAEVLGGSIEVKSYECQWKLPWPSFSSQCLNQFCIAPKTDLHILLHGCLLSVPKYGGSIIVQILRVPVRTPRQASQASDQCLSQFCIYRSADTAARLLAFRTEIFGGSSIVKPYERQVKLPATLLKLVTASASVSLALRPNRSANPAARLFVFRAEVIKSIRRQHRRQSISTPTHDVCAMSQAQKVLHRSKQSDPIAILGRINLSKVPMSKCRHVPQAAVLAQLSADLSAGCLCPRASDAIRRGRFAIPIMVRRHRKAKFADTHTHTMSHP